MSFFNNLTKRRSSVLLVCLLFLSFFVGLFDFDGDEQEFAVETAREEVLACEQGMSEKWSLGKSLEEKAKLSNSRFNMSPDNEYVFTEVEDSASELLGSVLAEELPYGSALIAMDVAGDTFSSWKIDGERGSYSWSPDGRRIASVIYGDVSNNVVILDLLSGKKAVLYSTTEWLGGLSWSPDGESIAFIESTPGSTVVVMRVDGSDLRRLATVDGFAGSQALVWSPDSTHIAWSDTDFASLKAVASLMVLYLPEARVVKLFEGGSIYGISWSPDGLQLAFSAQVEKTLFNSESRSIFLKSPYGSEEVIEVAHGERPHWSPDGLSFVFSRQNECNVDDLFQQKLDGSGVRQLTASAFDDYFLGWSADGEELQFRSVCENFKTDCPNRYLTLNMDSLSVTSLNLREKLVNLLKSHTAPSLRGLITFTLSTYADEPSDIYTMRADGFAIPMPLEIGEINGWTYQDKTPRISIDGRSVFTESADGDLELFVRSADGSETLQITDNEAQDSDPKWSPNGDRIVFVSDRDGDSEIFVTNKDGSKIIQITDNEVRDWDPKWSPDGKEIVFLSVPNGNEGEIFVTSSDGLETRQITDNGFWNESPVWSPDGQHIAFSSNFARCEDQATARRCMQIPWLATDIFVMKADGTDVQPLTDLTDDQMGYKVFEWSD